MQRLSIIGLFLFAAACSSKVTTRSSTTGTSTAGKYSEDISVWRPKEVVVDTVKKTGSTTTINKQDQQYVEPKFAVNSQLDNVLDSISRINLANGFVDGFTIQVYSGVKREEALNAKKELSVSLPSLDSDVQYVQPNFRVRVGKYYDRLQAQKDYQTIKRYFPNAIVIPERISIQ